MPVPARAADLIRLCESGVSRPALRQALAALGGADTVLAASPATLRATGLPADAIEKISEARDRDVGASLAWLQAPDHHLIAPGQPDWPPLLQALDDPPLSLWVRGDPNVLCLPQLAMVGSRSPTRPGEETAQQFARHLAAGGLTITSGFATGIDAAGHRGALAGGGTTVAVLGTGIDVAYPKGHDALAAQIAGHGALVSELPLGAPPLKHHFPARNRLIAGLSVGTLVVEAALRSGSLITARLAAEQGREVFAIPGSIHNPMARGCHKLLRDGAKLVESAQDIVEELVAIAGTLLPAGDALTSVPATAEDAPDPEYAKVLDAMGYEPAGVDTIARRAGLTAQVVSSMLLILELQGAIATAPGGTYVRLPGKEHESA